MILTLLQYTFLKELKNNFFSKWSYLTFILADLGSLFVYFYTAKAFIPKSDFSAQVGGDYFSFIVLGELTLLIPVTLLSLYSQQIKQCYFNGTLDLLRVSGRGIEKNIISLATPKLLIVLVKIIITFLFAILLFDFHMPLKVSFGFLVLQLISLPCFLGIGLAAAAVVIYFGRGDKALVVASNFLTVLAGVYFPLTVFSENIQSILVNFSPFGLLLNTVRELSTGNLSLETNMVFIYFLVSLVIFLLGYASIGISFKLLMKKKKAVVFT
ncbi:MAG: hypothetical protein HOO06_08035 [Bdellovibrionaceae bacterium]|jgi:hypothetical protein|nr:hypothetical protein [Pseudobdellovibrionaceae bacterium]